MTFLKIGPAGIISPAALRLVRARGAIGDERVANVMLVERSADLDGHVMRYGGNGGARQSDADCRQYAEISRSD